MYPIKITAILLAAGKASRFGSAKQLVVVEGQTLLNRIIQQYRQSNIDALIVVLGAHFQTIADSISADVQIIHCQDWQLGMSKSIRAGLRNISNDTTHVIIGLADQINLTSIHVDQLIALAQKKPQNIVAAKYTDILGCPAIFPRGYFSELEKLEGDKGARGILQQNIDSINSIEFPDLARDIDSHQDLIDWQNR